MVLGSDDMALTNLSLEPSWLVREASLIDAIEDVVDSLKARAVWKSRDMKWEVGGKFEVKRWDVCTVEAELWILIRGT
jgi:hypothetical protein